MELNEIIEQRKAKLASLKEKGGLGYSSPRLTLSDIGTLLANFQEGKKAAMAGRIMAMRLHGKAAFADLRDGTGKIQLYFKADSLGEETFESLKDVDIADIIEVEGELFKTHTGELTVKVEKFFMLAKALRSLPEKWHGLKDVEMRYRQRYLDLLSNEKVKEVFELRSRMIKAIRNFLDGAGFLEVETPMMQPVAGGAAGRPFKTFHYEYGLNLYLRIAPELYLKRLLVGGLDKVYEINRSFRNEGVSTRHNPEFTMLEVYRAYANYEDMMKLCQDLLIAVTREVKGSDKFDYQGKTVDLKTPWQKRSFAEMVKEKFAIEPQEDASSMLRKLKAKGFAIDKDRLSRSQINKVIEEILEQDMDANPVFVTDYFTHLCPLAQKKKDNPFLSERFELYVAGMEIANAYTELNDPEEQRKRFEEESAELNLTERKSVDEDYVLALEHGLPAAGGLGVGIDRLCMLLADQPSIRDVILFPLLRPQP